MKVIFLDIDGVLNCRTTQDRIEGYVGLCAERIARLNRITAAHPDAKIVISSTWRHAYHGDLRQLLKERGVTTEVIGQTPVKFSYVPRGGEIRMWLDDRRDDFPDEKLEYVVLDDDTDGMRGYPPHSVDLRPRHVVTIWDDNGGLQDEHVEKAIAILNGQLITVPDDGWVTVPDSEEA